MSLIVCPECGHENQEDARYCDMCGIELPLPVTIGIECPTSSALEPKEQESITHAEYNAITSNNRYSEPDSDENSQSPVGSTEGQEITLDGETEEKPWDAELVGHSPAPTPAPATVLDWDEPELDSERHTGLQILQALLLHRETGTCFPLPNDETLIYLGKINEEMPVQIDLSSLPDSDIISRVHAVIHVEEKNFYLEDAGSLNGTALNTEDLKPGARFRRELKSGDTITLGRNRKVNLIFEIQP